MTVIPATETPSLDGWNQYIKPFAEALGKTVDESTEILKSIVGNPGDQAIPLLQDASLSPDADIKAQLNGTPSAVANKAIKLLRAVDNSNAAASVMAFMGGSILPTVMSDESLLSALRAGGILKVEQSTVISAVRAALANRLGLFDIPDILARQMEVYADQNSEPVTADFYSMRKMLTQRNHADIFEAVPGLDSRFVTEKRKNDLFGRIDNHLWPAIILYNTQLKGWYEAWQQTASGPHAMMNIVNVIARGPNAVPGVMQMPDTGVLRDGASHFADQMNKVFSGTGAQIASALGYEAKQVKEALNNRQLPAMIGAANHEQMLRKLGVEVSANYPRMEENLVRFVLSIMNVDRISAGAEEQQYFTEMLHLASQIPWDDLSRGTRRTRSRD